MDEFLERFQTGLRAAINRHEVAALGNSPVSGIGQGPPDPVLAAQIATEIAPTLELLEQIVGAQYTVPALERFTIADCAFAPVLFRTLLTRLDLAPHPRLLSLRTALTERPSFKAAGPVL